MSDGEVSGLKVGCYAGKGRLEPAKDDVIQQGQFFEASTHLVVLRAIATLWLKWTQRSSNLLMTERAHCHTACATPLAHVQAISFIESQLGAHGLPFAMHHMYYPEEQRIPEASPCAMASSVLMHAGNTERRRAANCCVDNPLVEAASRSFPTDHRCRQRSSLRRAAPSAVPCVCSVARLATSTGSAPA